MDATVMTIEFGATHHYSSLDEILKLLQSFSLINEFSQKENFKTLSNTHLMYQTYIQ